MNDTTTVSITNMGNAAFSDGNHRDEVARILRDVAAKIEAGHACGSLQDINGNKVGVWNMDEPEQEPDDEALERAQEAINDETTEAVDVATEHGQLFENVKHMDWFKVAVAKALAE